MLFRYAPTPSGLLHLGNGVNFTLTYLLARSLGASILLRIDDLDTDRKRPDYVDDVFRSLDYLGLTYEQGPTGPDDFERNWSQRHRLPLYEQTLAALVETGQIYATAYSRQQIGAMGAGANEQMRAQKLPFTMQNVAWRVRIDQPQLIDNQLTTDFVVRQRSGVPAYQVASLTDDLHFAVTHLVRGDDLRESTAMQQYMARLLGHEAFAQIPVWHHPLLTDSAGNKLSKSVGSTSLKVMREAGQSPALVFEEVAKLLGLPPEAGESLRALEQAFSVKNNLPA
jgi:glutamyl-tRNA synthetase